jgi:hypothetical protein
MPSLPRLPCASSCTRLDAQIPPASANDSSRAATFIPVTMDAGTFYDIPNVYSHPEIDLPICRNPRVPLGHCALDLYRATQRVHRTNEQDQQSVASSPYDPTTMFFNLGFNEFSMMRVQLGEGAFIVDAYQAAVAGYIRHQDCHKVGVRFAQ